MWLIKNRSATSDHSVKLPSYDVVVPAASILRYHNVGGYIDSLNVLEIKTTGWDEISYDISLPVFIYAR